MYIPVTHVSWIQRKITSNTTGACMTITDCCGDMTFRKKAALLCIHSFNRRGRLWCRGLQGSVLSDSGTVSTREVALTPNMNEILCSFIFVFLCGNLNIGDLRLVVSNISYTYIVLILRPKLPQLSHFFHKRTLQWMQVCAQNLRSVKYLCLVYSFLCFVLFPVRNEEEKFETRSNSFHAYHD